MVELIPDASALSDEYRRLNASGAVSADVLDPEVNLREAGAVPESFDQVRLQPTQLVGHHHDKIVLRVWVMGIPTGSRAMTRPIVRRHVFHVWSMSGGRPQLCRAYATRAEALAAARGDSVQLSAA